MNKYSIFVYIFQIWLVSKARLCYATACATANVETFEFSGTLTRTSNRDEHQWEVKPVEVAKDLILDVEIINGDKIPLLKKEKESMSFPTPIVFIHGWTDSRLNWMTVIPQVLAMDSNIVDNNQIIILPTLRGFGDSQIFPASSQFTIEEFSEDIIKLLDKLGFDMTNEKFNIVGHSMGGAIATYLTVHYSKNINKVIFIGTLSDWTQLTFGQNNTLSFNFDETKNEPNKQQLLEMAKNSSSNKADRGGICASFANILNRENVKADSKAARLSWDSLLSFNLSKEFINVINNKDNYNFNSMTSSIKCLIIFGEHDIVPTQLQVNFADTLGEHATIARFDNCGHSPHYFYSVQVATKIIQFVTGIEEDD